MRSEQEMLDLILDIAKSDERIRAVILNGSRANPNAPRDIFQDFDIVYLVTEMAPFVRNLEWIKCFGEIMILQMPEDMELLPPENDGHFGYLMQFSDGNRIDLGFYPLEKLAEVTSDSLGVLLLDKDGIIPPFAPASEADYLPTPSSAKLFADCCNEFWWVSTYVAKGLWRQELLYAKFMLEQPVREQLMNMLKWYIGVKTGFSVNPGKFGKYYQRYLEPELWDLLEKTFSDASYQQTWEALFALGDLFRVVALRVAEYFGFQYNLEEDQKVNAHLRHVRALPREAREIY